MFSPRGKHARRSALQGKVILKPRSRGSTPVLGKLCGGTAGFQLPVVQAQCDEFLKAGIDLLMHGRILRGDIAQLLQQAGSAVVVVPLRILQPLAVMSSMGLWGTPLTRSGPTPLHGLSPDGHGLGNFPLADRAILLLG